MPRTKGAVNKHKKERPHKAKKPKGRKPRALGHSPEPKDSIKQKQSQRQTVNVNIDSDKLTNKN